MKISVSEKTAIFDMLCGTKHVFFVVDDRSGNMGVMFKMNYVKQSSYRNLFSALDHCLQALTLSDSSLVHIHIELET